MDFPWVKALLLFGALLGSAPAHHLYGQGVLNTGLGQPLVTGMRSVFVDAGLADPQILFRFGFATDETFVPGGLQDSLTVTFQDTAASATLVLLTADASGVVWAPPTPGALVIAPETIVRTPMPYPPLSPALAYRAAFTVSAPVPSALVGGPVNVFFDLFDNLNTTPSQGWFSELTVVPEPTALVLGSVAVGMFFALRRATKCNSMAQFKQGRGTAGRSGPLS